MTITTTLPRCLLTWAHPPAKYGFNSKHGFILLLSVKFNCGLFFLNKLYKAIPNWDEIKTERRKRHRALTDKEDHISRKKAKLQAEEKTLILPVEVMEDYDDDEDMEKLEEDHTPANTLTEMEKTVFHKLTPQMAAEMVLASMVWHYVQNMSALHMSHITDCVPCRIGCRMLCLLILRRLSLLLRWLAQKAKFDMFQDYFLPKSRHSN